MTTLHPLLATRVFNTPLLIHPLKGKVIAEALSARMGLGEISLVDANGRPLAGDWFDDDDEFDRKVDRDPGYDVIQGVAVISITGTLVHRTNSIRPYCGMLGYNAIRAAFLTAIDDPEVRAVVLLCNSPGGEVSGCFDLVDVIHAARGRKPMWAIVDDMAYSACYALASACDKICVPRTGGVGSVGVVTMAAEFSRQLDKAGVSVRIFVHGARKAAGNPYEPLDDETAAEIQDEIHALGNLFDETAARDRGLSVASIQALQARTYMGAAGVDVGLADAVMAPDEAFRVLLAELG